MSAPDEYDTELRDVGQAPESELGDLATHVVPAETVELHQLNELSELSDDELAELEQLK